MASEKMTLTELLIYSVQKWTLPQFVYVITVRSQNSPNKINMRKPLMSVSVTFSCTRKKPDNHMC